VYCYNLTKLYASLLRYGQEGHGFESQWYYVNFSLIPQSIFIALEPTQLLTEMSTRNILCARRVNNFTTYMCQLSWNLEASTSWNLQGLSRSVQGLLCLYMISLYGDLRP